MKRVFISIKEFFCGKKKKSQSSKVETKPFEFPLNMDDPSPVSSGKIDNSQKAYKKFKREQVKKEIDVTIRHGRIANLTEKEKWIFEYLRNNSQLNYSATEIGREYGIKVKQKDHYTSWHSRNVLIKLVNFKLVKRTFNNRYTYNHI